MHQTYPARFEADDGAILVTFPDLPEAITGGATEAEAVANAADALEVALLTYLVDGRSLPAPGTHSGTRWISIGAATAAKMAFIEAFNTSGLTRTALAAQLGKAENEVRRMLDPYHATKLPALEAGLRAMGKKFVISVENIAA